MCTSFRAARLAAIGLAATAFPLLAQTPRAARPLACETDNDGLVLPQGFCAVLVAKDLGPVRLLAVAPNGDLYAALSGGSAAAGREDVTGGVLAFRDADGDGKPDERAAFGSGTGNDVKVHDGYVYFAQNDRVVRWKLAPPQLKPGGAMETVVSGLPGNGNHYAKSIAFDGRRMYVNIGSATNSCQEVDRKPASKGKQPCTELEQRAGIWAFDAERTGQTLADGKRFATGARNSVALAVKPGTSQVWIAVNGRDQLGRNWGFSNERNAENPGEEMVQIKQGDDLGWPYCYYETTLKHKVLAPEYGGDGKAVGDCDKKTPPTFVFPAHYAPIGLAFYDGDKFGPSYKGGAFIAFHGSWNRAPLPPGGYQVGFVTFRGGKPVSWDTFARLGDLTALRPTGVAVAPDGSLYVSADRNGKIWRITKQ